MLACFAMIVATTEILSQTQNHVFLEFPRIGVPNTPSMCLNFNFSVQGLSNLNCLQGMVGKGH